MTICMEINNLEVWTDTHDKVVISGVSTLTWLKMRSFFSPAGYNVRCS